MKQSYNFLRASRSIAKTGFSIGCQIFMLRSFLELFPGRKKCWKSCPKGSPNGPQKSTKIDKKRVQEGSQKETSKTDPLQDQEKWDCAAIYCTLARSEVSKNTHLWVPFWGPFGSQNHWTQGSHLSFFDKYQSFIFSFFHLLSLMFEAVFHFSFFFILSFQSFIFHAEALKLASTKPFGGYP